MPDHIVSGQVLLVDVPSQEIAIVNDIRALLKSALGGVGRRSFARVKPCPDHRLDGQIVQVADMIAGALQDEGTVSGSWLGSLQKQITLI